MHTVTKALALAVLAGSAALMTPSSQAQGAPRDRDPFKPRPTPTPQCCALAVRPIGTNAVSWTVQTSANPPVAAVLVGSRPYWAAAMPGSQWISTTASAGTYPGVAPGLYTYTYHFCLCELPQGSSGAPPAAMSLKVLSDNQFTAYLNGNQIGQNTATDTTPFTYPTTIANVPASFFQPGDNVLRFVVTNGFAGQENTGWQSSRQAAPAQSAQSQTAQAQGSNPSGLDVAGSISGYFLDLPPNRPCPRVPPRDASRVRTRG